MKDNMSFQNDSADVLLYNYFQAYSNIKRSLQYNPEDLLVTQRTATAALTLPTTDAQQSASVRAKQQRLLQQLQGDVTSEDLDASWPFVHEQQHIQHTVAEEEFVYQIEQVVNIDVERLILQRQNLQTILQPIFQLMCFYL
jgi:hypothetical protein